MVSPKRDHEIDWGTTEHTMQANALSTRSTKVISEDKNHSSRETNPPGDDHLESILLTNAAIPPQELESGRDPQGSNGS